MTCKHCEKPAKYKSLQLCHSHYMRLKRHGDPIAEVKHGGSKALQVGDTCRNGHLVEGDNARFRTDNRLGRTRVVCRTCQQEIDRNKAKSARAKKAAEKAKVVPSPPEAVVDSTVTKAEGANLAKSTGIDIRSLLIKNKAVPYWDALQKERLTSDYNCKGREAEFSDYEKKPTPQEAIDLCAGCPLLLTCAQFARAENPGWGVWGGRAYGEDDDEQSS